MAIQPISLKLGTYLQKNCPHVSIFHNFATNDSTIMCSACSEKQTLDYPQIAVNNGIIENIVLGFADRHAHNKTKLEAEIKIGPELKKLIKANNPAPTKEDYEESMDYSPYSKRFRDIEKEIQVLCGDYPITVTGADIMRIKNLTGINREIEVNTVAYEKLVQVDANSSSKDNLYKRGNDFLIKKKIQDTHYGQMANSKTYQYPEYNVKGKLTGTIEVGINDLETAHKEMVLKGYFPKYSTVKETEPITVSIRVATVKNYKGRKFRD